MPSYRARQELTEEIAKVGVENRCGHQTVVVKDKKE